MNCAAIPPALIASELFGHEKGAFTGALQRRLGRFEAAHGGTIFLDEIGDLPAETQIALLRERVEDIPLLVEYLIERYATRAGKKIRTINKRTLELFQTYDWPGNIRELQNVIERAVILCESDTFAVEESWLKREAPLRAGPAVSLVAARTEHDRALIEAVLSACRGRVSSPAGAAAKLGLPRQTLESKIKALGIPV